QQGQDGRLGIGWETAPATDLALSAPEAFTWTGAPSPATGPPLSRDCFPERSLHRIRAWAAGRSCPPPSGPGRAGVPAFVGAWLLRRLTKSLGLLTVALCCLRPPCRLSHPLGQQAPVFLREPCPLQKVLESVL